MAMASISCDNWRVTNAVRSQRESVINAVDEGFQECPHTVCIEDGKVLVLGVPRLALVPPIRINLGKKSIARMLRVGERIGQRKFELHRGCKH